ncbi:kelch-like protein [Leptospira sp. 2 VSF19]|uniref:Kelch-like protein n=1 Tax=Leptospira soteropolitanensis TaxID=2950025 RepID=A0AAW5VEV5_9LEPT|nr:kelch repeat-containing protein [Leptospira soteropolitanensis]MCW7492685.1 kelch-like protein [Leptospira soteropolitanensis]MCW7500368.1 kelch-like protein [Leptospira soteropolitanensis]MCW7522597.1 kelch-like protein [Leptospira soteropolitanensis]MCW7526453.1 kelch-like protein [Leptospira soteropolitanensis]MCW7530338.1 kelch-like protein [Leptospira soteropolitanensis]
MAKIRINFFVILLVSCKLGTGNNLFDPNSPASLGLLLLGSEPVVTMEFSTNRVQPGGVMYVSTNHDFTTKTNGLKLPIAGTSDNPISQIIPRSKFLYEIRMNPSVTTGRFRINLKDYYSNESLLVNPETFEFEIDSEPPILELRTGNGIDISELESGFLDIVSNEEIVWDGDLSQVSLSGTAKNTLVVSDIITSDRNIRLLFAGNPNSNGGILTISFANIKDKASNSQGTVMVPINVYAFKSGPNLNVARRSCVGVELDDGRRLVLGGKAKKDVVINGNGTLSHSEFYDSISKTFIQGPDMVYRRQEFEAIKLLDGRIFVTSGIGGKIGSSNDGLTSTEVYDPVTNTWAEGPHLSVPRLFHKMTVLPNGDVLVVGGMSPYKPIQSVGSVELVHITNNPATMTVELIGNLSDPRGKHAQILSQAAGKVIIFGGERSDVFGPLSNDFIPNALDTIEIYDINTKTLSKSQAKVYKRFNHFVHGLKNGEILVLGGINSRFDNAQPVLRAQIYNPLTDTIRDHKNLLFGREWGSSFVFPYGKDQLIVAGGLEYRTINGSTFDSIHDTESWSESSNRFYVTSRSLNARWDGCDIRYHSVGGGMILGGRVGDILGNTEEYSFE